MKTFTLQLFNSVEFCRIPVCQASNSSEFMAAAFFFRFVSPSKLAVSTQHCASGRDDTRSKQSSAKTASSNQQDLNRSNRSDLNYAPIASPIEIFFLQYMEIRKRLDVFKRKGRNLEHQINKIQQIYTVETRQGSTLHP